MAPPVVRYTFKLFGNETLSDYVQHRARNAARRLGFEVVQTSKNQRAESLLGLHLDKLFHRLGVNVVIDAGARHGEYGIWLRSNGYSGHILSFEPVPENYLQLKRVSRSDPLWSAYQFALGAQAGILPINVTNGTMFSSFHEPNSYAQAEFGESTHVSRVEDVQVRRLDEIWSAVMQGFPTSAVFLKMDTQGWDVEILKGATGKLTQLSAFQSEVSAKALYDNIPSLQDSLMTFSRLGFQLSGLFPVHYDASFAVIDLDCVMVRCAE